jgi:hypothetical protein
MSGQDEDTPIRCAGGVLRSVETRSYATPLIDAEMEELQMSGQSITLALIAMIAVSGAVNGANIVLAAKGSSERSSTQKLFTSIQPRFAQAAKGQGAPCSGDLECQMGVCYKGSCGRPSKPHGASCADDLDCQESVCYKGSCGRPSKPHGASCADNLDCQAGNCTANVCQ